MSSERKIQSARANGAKSRGPKTPEGKQASSRNAIVHGLTAEAIVIEGESPAGFNQHWQEFIDEHQPHTKTEHELVYRMAVASWRLHRNYAREASIINLRMIEQAESLDPDVTPADRATLAFRSLADARCLDLLNRYETRDRRAFDQALKTLLQLKSARNRRQQEPTTHPLPPTTSFPNEPNAPLPTHPETPPNYNGPSGGSGLQPESCTNSRTPVSGLVYNESIATQDAPRQRSS